MNLQGHRILIVEDEILIGLDLTDIFADQGAEVAGPAMSVEEALRLIQDGLPTLAVLDIWLGNGTSLPIAQKLAGAKVPFILHTGHFDGDTAPEGWPPVPLVRKPATPQALFSGLTRAMQTVTKG